MKTVFFQYRLYCRWKSKKSNFSAKHRRENYVGRRNFSYKTEFNTIVKRKTNHGARAYSSWNSFDKIQAETYITVECYHTWTLHQTAPQ